MERGDTGASGAVRAFLTQMPQPACLPLFGYRADRERATRALERLLWLIGKMQCHMALFGPFDSGRETVTDQHGISQTDRAAVEE